MRRPKLLIFPRSRGHTHSRHTNLELSMKCPIDIRNTAQQGSPSQPRHIGTNSMPTSQNSIKCPIEVGVGAEAHFGVDPRHKGLNSKLRPPELPLRRGSIDAKSELQFTHHPHEAHKCKEAVKSRVKWGHPELPGRNASRSTQH